METRGSGSKLIFSVDLEDWYHGIEIPHAEWTRFEDRVHVGMEELLPLLKLHETKATFFVLGSVAEKHPSLIERIVDQGHEIGPHGYYHQKVYELTEMEFDDEIKRAVKALKAITGSQVRGHRAPYFSITSRSTWAFKVLRDNGIQYDANVFPGHNWRYGIPNTPDTSYLVQPYDLIEFSRVVLSQAKLQPLSLHPLLIAHPILRANGSVDALDEEQAAPHPPS